MQFLRQVICNSERGTEILQRGLSSESQTIRNGTEEHPLQSRPTTHRDTASGVFHLFQHHRLSEFSAAQNKRYFPQGSKLHHSFGEGLL